MPLVTAMLTKLIKFPRVNTQAGDAARGVRTAGGDVTFP
jgi:hypothetical protein